MSQPVLQLQDSSKWLLTYDERREAKPTGASDTFYPIPAFEVGVAFESPIIAVRCLSTTAKARWRFAGTLSQRFPLGTGGAASSLPTVTAGFRSLRLNRSQLVQFQRLTSTYELTLESPPWVKDLRFTVWQYTGSISDTSFEILETLKVDLLRVESKIDSF